MNILRFFEEKTGKNIIFEENSILLRKKMRAFFQNGENRIFFGGLGEKIFLRSKNIFCAKKKKEIVCEEIISRSEIFFQDFTIESKKK